MKVLLNLYVIGYVICQTYNLDQAYEFLIQNQQQLILAQWTESADHLIYLNIVFDNKNLILQVYPKKNNILHEKHQFRLSYELINSSYHFDSVNKRLCWNDILVEIRLQNDQKHPPFQCAAQLQLEIPSSETQTKIVVNSKFDSQCKINEERIKLFIFSNSNYYKETLIYMILMLIISTLQIISSIAYLKCNQLPNKNAALTLSIILTQDIYICIFSSFLFDESRIIYYFPCLIIQTVSILYDLKVKAQLTENENIDKKKNIAIQIFELLTITYLFQNIRHSNSLILLNCFLLPQIISTYFNRDRQRFQLSYLGILYPRTLLSIYARACPENILQLLPKFDIVIVIILILLLQFLIYYCQCQFGWFILKRNMHNYFIKYNEDSILDDCAICLFNLKQFPENKQTLSEPVVQRSLMMASQNHLLMNTPCNHLFHASCLTQWMEINLTCPLCKSALPQIF